MSKKRAHKSKLTPELQERLVAFLRAGNYVETAAACAGIHKDTFYEWCKKGRKGEEPFAAFVEAVDKAIAESEARDVALIGKAATVNWQAAAWRLERKMSTSGNVTSATSSPARTAGRSRCTRSTTSPPR